MAGLAKLGDKNRSKSGAKHTNSKRKKRKEKFHERVSRLRKELPWPYNTLIELKKERKK